MMSVTQKLSTLDAHLLRQYVSRRVLKKSLRALDICI